MIRRIVKSSPFVAAWLLFSSVAAVCGDMEQLSDDCPMRYRFAKSLMADMDYYRAISEFKRYMFYCPEGAELSEARYNIVLSYFLAGRYNEVLAWHRKSGISFSADNRLTILAGKSNYRLKHNSISVEQLSGVLNNDPSRDEYYQACYYSGLSLVRLEDFSTAIRYFDRVEDSSPYFDNSRAYIKYLSTEDYYESKKPKTAGLLAIMPGAGYLYTRHYHTAVASLVVNGLLLWASVSAFQNDRNAEGIIFSTFFVGFYLGNIYGSVQSANRFNDYHRNNFHSQFKE